MDWPSHLRKKNLCYTIDKSNLPFRSLQKQLTFAIISNCPSTKKNGFEDMSKVGFFRLLSCWGKKIVFWGPKN